MSTGRYRSPLREQQAEETRRHIRQAALELFQDRGFTATTIADIARRAGVSSATVYAVYESKAGIVRAMLEGLEEAADMGDRIAEMLAEPDPSRSLDLFVASNRAVFEFGHAVLRAAYDSVGTPEVRAFIDGGNANRRRGCDTLVGRWRRAGVLRPGLRPTRAAETMWLLSSPEQYLLATDTLGWSGETYEAWLRALLRDVLFGVGD